jgi:hypothetical protein
MQWVIPPEANAAYIASMEDVLEFCQRPHDQNAPSFARTKQRNNPSRRPAYKSRPNQDGQPGTTTSVKIVNLFVLFAPLEGWRHVEVADRHAALDYAQVLKDLSDKHFRRASKIVLVQDNLSTHKPTSLHKAFPAAKARRLVERFEWHYTPKHGSWLNMARSELRVSSRQCLERWIPTRQP